MARVAMIGGGLVGLCAATMLGRDGHEVTVAERDPAPPPPSPLDAWTTWQRRGVSQFRQLHYFLPRFRHVVEAELPDVADTLDAAGALRFNPISGLPPSMTGGWRPGDDRFEVLTGRRPLMEAVVAATAAREPNVDVRRGKAVRSLVTRRNGAVPEVAGILLDSGEEIDADVVIDASGRRSCVSDLLAQAGAPRPLEENHDHGFVYYARHFRSADGSTPTPIGPLLQHCGSVSIVTLPADNGHWGVGIVASGKDRVARAMRSVEVWERVLRSFPLVAHWADGEPLTDDVEIMANIADRYRRFVIGDRPVAIGVLPLADAFACTNPSLGRGIAIGMMHAVALRDLLHDAADGGGALDRDALTLAWDRITDETVGGYVRDTLSFDQHRLAQIDAILEGRAYETDDVSFHMSQAFLAAAPKDADVLRHYLEVVSVLERAPDVLSDRDVAERVVRLGADGPDLPPGPDRAELEQLLST